MTDDLAILSFKKETLLLFLIKHSISIFVKHTPEQISNATVFNFKYFGNDIIYQEYFSYVSV